MPANYKGLGVARYNGVHESATAAGDILTLTGIASASGDYLVWENSAGTEQGYIDAAGDINMVAGSDIDLGKTDQTTFSKLNLPILNTAASSAGLLKGDVFLAKATTDIYRMVLCISTATGAVKYSDRFIRNTLSAT